MDGSWHELVPGLLWKLILPDVPVDKVHWIFPFVIKMAKNATVTMSLQLGKNDPWNCTLKEEKEEELLDWYPANSCDKKNPCIVKPVRVHRWSMGDETGFVLQFVPEERKQPKGRFAFSIGNASRKGIPFKAPPKQSFFGVRDAKGAVGMFGSQEAHAFFAECVKQSTRKRNVKPRDGVDEEEGSEEGTFMNQHNGDLDTTNTSTLKKRDRQDPEMIIPSESVEKQRRRRDEPDPSPRWQALSRRVKELESRQRELDNLVRQLKSQLEQRPLIPFGSGQPLQLEANHFNIGEQELWPDISAFDNDFFLDHSLMGDFGN